MPLHLPLNRCRRHPLDEFNSETDSDYSSYWRDWFISSRGHEYFCEIDEEYLTDRFNLTGLNTEVQYYQYALDLVTDVFDFECNDDMREQIEKSARHLYGLLEKYKKYDFGRCPRVLCAGQPLLPIGLSDLPNVKSVKLYCGRCEDVYVPKSSRHAVIDGAYFGASFPHILFQVYPQLIPQKNTDRYTPRCFGFKVHASAALLRWQEQQRTAQRRRLIEAGVEVPTQEEAEKMQDSDDDEEEEIVDPLEEGEKADW
ncbi:hypothetical protein H072_2490 [Dactylellina haptotyla CBS 200.50]|uniref:Casein kinase II subunit beta n=1 Tax=Dactylellina haptotyla (strain CBS 200.50) TaxID=1284197 RepID=S8C731_DACHA|nr:hypothetical protein H072_2490 [Dactylellina haptotyla CBS 200.50]